jgi:hypothetical protein
MEMIELIAKLKAFKKSLVSKKTPVLMILNKQLPKNSGKLIDFSLNKAQRAINIELKKDGAVNYISVFNYAVHLVNNETHITWSKISASGKHSAHLNQVFKHQKSIALPAYLYNTVSSVMSATT